LYSGRAMENDPLSADERRLFDELAADIEEELFVQVTIGRLQDPAGVREGVSQTAGLIADVVWQKFEVKARDR
jgi:hypothetical protein